MDIDEWTLWKGWKFHSNKKKKKTEILRTLYSLKLYMHEKLVIFNLCRLKSYFFDWLKELLKSGLIFFNSLEF